MDPPHADGKGQIVYLSHGGGPLPILGDPGHRTLAAFLRRLPERLEKPEAVLVISAHWEEAVATLQGAAAPALLYDYYGFPEEAYTITYPAPGAPQLASRIADTLSDHGLSAHIDAQRGFDHGLFIPLKLMFPDADVPALQLSLLQSLDAEAHIALGRALRTLMRERVLVIGSGFSFHNMQAFSWQQTDTPDAANDAFQDWLIATCCQPRPSAEREQRLAQWEAAPHARYCHPREEHLLPLHVCAGMANGPAEVIFDDYVLGKRGIALQWV